MDENFDFNEETGDEANLVERFESMLSSNASVYFDSDELEDLFGHYLINGDLDKCQSVVNLAKELHPKSSQTLFISSQLYFEVGQLKDCLDTADALLIQDQENIDAYLLKSQVYIQLEEKSRGIKYLKKAARLSDPEEAFDLWMDVAMEYESIDRYDSAIETLTQLISEYTADHPSFNQALYELAYCYDLAGKVDECVSFYKAFLDKDPYSFVGWYNLGNAYCKQAHFDKAISAFDFAIAIKDDLSSAHFNKGNALAHLGLYEASIESFEATIQHEGCQAITLNYIGESYEKMGEYEKAFSYYQHASELDPELSEPWIGMGVIKDLSNQPKEALKFIEKAVQLDQDHAANWLMLANAYEKNDDLAQAEEAYRTSLSIQKNLSEVWTDYANFLMENNRNEEAIDLLLEGIELSPQYKDAFEYRLVVCLFKFGKREEAMGYLEDALQINFGGHKDLLEYCPEILERAEVLKLIESYSKNDER